MNILLPKPNWQSTGTDPNDLIAHYGDHYTFRIEHMRKGCWWYAIYKNSQEIVSEMNARCKKEAKKMLREMRYQLYF